MRQYTEEETHNREVALDLYTKTILNWDVIQTVPAVAQNTNTTF